MSKGNINKIGIFNSEGQPIGWEFSDMDTVFEFDNDCRVKIAGYTIEELIEIYKGSAK